MMKKRCTLDDKSLDILMRISYRKEPFKTSEISQVFDIWKGMKERRIVSRFLMTTEGMARFSLFYFKESSRHCRLDDSVSTLFHSSKYFSSFMSTGLVRRGVRSHAHALAHAQITQGVRFIARLESIFCIFFFSSQQSYNSHT